MNEIHINQYRLVENAHERPYGVYDIEIKYNGSKFYVEKRYSQFHAFHKELRKSYPTPAFPPKKVRSLNPKVLEQRRELLEVYLQVVFKQSSKLKVLEFLGINQDASSEVQYSIKRESFNTYPPIFQFKEDCFIDDKRISNLTDIIKDGVLFSLYKHL